MYNPDEDLELLDEALDWLEEKSYAAVEDGVENYEAQQVRKYREALARIREMVQ